MFEQLNSNRHNRRCSPGIAAITIVLAVLGATGSSQTTTSSTNITDLRAINVRQLAPATIRLPVEGRSSRSTGGHTGDSK